MLDKRSKNIVIIFGIALLGIILMELFRPQPVDWRESYTSFDKIPLGTYILHNEIKSFYNSVENVNRDPFEFLSCEKTENHSAYFFLNNDLFFDDRQTEKLLEYASEGNIVFISARSIGGNLSDTLKVKTDVNYQFKEEEIYPQFYNKNLKSDSLYQYKKTTYKSRFLEIDTLKTTALGYYKDAKNPEKSLNYISIPYGKGKFLIHTLPEAFSNYYMLKNNEQYAAGVLSYINTDKIYWDEYLKSGRKVVTSPMRFVLSQEALIWAYYILMCGLLIFVIFQGKRKQRIIPVIEPLKNSSVEFTKTIGSLYFQHSDYSNIIAKKIAYFLEQIRSRYYLNTQNLSEDFIKSLSIKSGKNEEEIRKLIHFINYLKGKPTHSEQDLAELNKQIDQFEL